METFWAWWAAHGVWLQWGAIGLNLWGFANGLRWANKHRRFLKEHSGGWSLSYIGQPPPPPSASSPQFPLHISQWGILAETPSFMRDACELLYRRCLACWNDTDRVPNSFGSYVIQWMNTLNDFELALQKLEERYRNESGPR